MTAADRMATDYLDRLAALTADLPTDLRDDVLADVRSHLDEARAAAPSETAFRQWLDRLGSPEAIAAEARAGVSPVPVVGSGAAGTPPGPGRARRVRGLDVTAVVLMAGGGLLLLPIIGFFALFVWVIGIAMLWASPTWSTGEKTLGTLVWPGGLFLPASLALLGGETCIEVEENGVMIEQSCTGFSFPVWIGIPLLIVTVVAPIAVAIVLLRRADARAA